MLRKYSLILLVSIMVISCENNLEEPINPLFTTWVFYSATYIDCDNNLVFNPSIYPCDDSSCLQVTFEDSVYYVMDVKYGANHQKKVSDIIVNENTFTCIDDLGNYPGICNGRGIATKYKVSGDTLTLKYRVDYENCTQLSILIKKN